MGQLQMLCFIFKCSGKPSQVFKQQVHLFYVPGSLAFPWGRKPGGKGGRVNLGKAFRGYGSRHAQSLQCWTLYNPIDCSSPGSSVHGILQASILEWVAMPSSRGSSQPKDQTHSSFIGRQVLYYNCTTWEAQDVTITNFQIHRTFL